MFNKYKDIKDKSGNKSVEKIVTCISIKCSCIHSLTSGSSSS